MKIFSEKNEKSIQNEDGSLFQGTNPDFAARWIQLHYFCGVLLSVITAVIELLGYFVISKVGLMEASPQLYIIKYFAIPGICNLLCMLFCRYIQKHTKNLYTKACSVSLMMVFIISIVYTVHAQFDALCIGFSATIILTVIYGSRRITTITALTALALKVLSDLFIHYDPTCIRFTDSNDYLNFSISIIAIDSVYALSLVLILVEQEKQKLITDAEKAHLRLFQETITDPLTGIQNRNGLHMCFDRIKEDTSDNTYIFVMIDLDHFKEANDTYGHQVGDQYLQQLSHILKVVPDAEAFRYGGDEFCLVFHNCSEADVLQRCTNVQEAYADCEISHKIKSITVSFGAAVYNRALSMKELVHRADQALYTAKQNRGSIVFYEE